MNWCRQLISGSSQSQMVTWSWTAAAAWRQPRSLNSGGDNQSGIRVDALFPTLREKHWNANASHWWSVLPLFRRDGEQFYPLPFDHIVCHYLRLKLKKMNFNHPLQLTGKSATSSTSAWKHRRHLGGSAKDPPQKNQRVLEERGNKWSPWISYWLLNNSSRECKNAKRLTNGILREKQTNYYTYLRKLWEEKEM